jgi:hypothetical protein
MRGNNLIQASNLLYGKKARPRKSADSRLPVRSGIGREHLPYNWHHSLQVNYRSQGGGPHGECVCPEDDFCRCTVIKDAHVETLDGFAYITADILNEHPELIEEKSAAARARVIYGIDRGLRVAGISTRDFDVSVSGGYYGDEIDSVTLTEEAQQKIDSVLSKLPLHSNTELVCHLLKAEKKRSAESLKGKKFDLQKIELADIKFSAPPKENQFFISTHSSVIAPQLGPWPRAVLEQSANNHYRVIDGHHRLSELAESKEADAIWAYVTKEN